MVTLAFGTIVQIFINELTPITNGPLGITLPPARVLDFSLFGMQAALGRGRRASSNSTISSAPRCC